jgi:hypothetical protein
MAKQQPSPERREAELRGRLEARGFVLEQAQHAWGCGYRVRNALGFIAIGDIPHPHSATLDAIEAFTIAQEL